MHRVTSRMGRVSRNVKDASKMTDVQKVTSRMGRVSRNEQELGMQMEAVVTSRMGRVSRNLMIAAIHSLHYGHVPHGACE